MWAIIELIKELFHAWNTRNSPDAVLRRKEVKDAVREGEAKATAEQLKGEYAEIEHEKKTGDDLLDSLHRK